MFVLYCNLIKIIKKIKIIFFSIEFSFVFYIYEIKKSDVLEFIKF